MTLCIDPEVDLSTSCTMTNENPSSRKRLPQRETQIIGFRLPKELAKQVKEESARRGIPLNALFDEIWSLYKSTGKPERR